MTTQSIARVVSGLAFFVLLAAAIMGYVKTPENTMANGILLASSLLMGLTWLLPRPKQKG